MCAQKERNIAGGTRDKDVSRDYCAFMVSYGEYVARACHRIAIEFGLKGKAVADYLFLKDKYLTLEYQAKCYLFCRRASSFSLLLLT
jgi:hypothetical protein